MLALGRQVRSALAVAARTDAGVGEVTSAARRSGAAVLGPPGVCGHRGDVTTPEERPDDRAEAGPPSDGPAEPVLRPAPHRWLWYAFGGRLPARHGSWVLFDTTTRTWGWRHVARSVVQMSVPIILIMVLLPADWRLRLAVAGGGVALGMIYSLAYMPETTEHRVKKAGYPVGLATTIRDRAYDDRQRLESERKRAAAARRAARYRDRMGR